MWGYLNVLKSCRMMAINFAPIIFGLYLFIHECYANNGYIRDTSRY